MTLLSASILLLLVMDPFGNAPLFLCVLKDVPIERRQKVIIRELLIALLVLALFLLMGPPLLKALQISEASLQIAGGIILFLIAIKMIFSSPEGMFPDALDGEPMIVPLAIPSIAGPSAIATVMLLTGQEPNRWPVWLLSLLLAWIVTSVILLIAAQLDRVLGKRGLSALQNLMGLILTALAVEMFLVGLRTAF
jgi:multiple antibiotic resistance protein